MALQVKKLAMPYGVEFSDVYFKLNRLSYNDEDGKLYFAGAFYLNKAYWSDEPIAHIVPHWNFEGLEGKDILVTVYTNCEELELFLNGQSHGKKQIEKYGSRGGNVVVPDENVVPEPLPKVVPFEKKVSRKSHQAHCIIGARAYSFYDSKRIPLILLINYLGL